MDKPGERVAARVVLAVALAVAWLNFLLTTKWAALPGALNGPKRPWYGTALALATVLMIVSRRRETRIQLRGAALAAVAALAFLVYVFLAVFPPSSWHLLPFDDDWVPRFQSTVDGVALLRHGVVVAWQWAFLGGYQTSADLAQNMTVVGALPMIIFGDRVGFHLLQFLLIAGIPFLVWRDIASDGDRPTAWLTGFLALMCAIGFFGTLVPSGDTNSIAGVFAAMVALTGSRLAAAGRRFGSLVLVGGLALALYDHAAFFGYAVVYLVLESLYYRDRARALRLAIAVPCAAVVALPQFFELLAYHRYFLTNNLVYGPVHLDRRVLFHIAHEIFYNVQILVLPSRWFNDYLSLVKVFLAVFVFVAVRPGRSRARLYAWFGLATMALLQLNAVEVGYLFDREMHMLAAFAAPPLAFFAVHYTWDRRLAWALAAVFGLYPQTGTAAVPHVRTVRDFDPALVDRLAALDGARVLLENSPHRDLDSSPATRTERTPFNVHFEAYLPETTGKLYYGQTWDCWHWTPFRGEVVAGGSFRGEAIDKTSLDDFEREMRKWGVRHLVVWSVATRRYLDAAPDRFVRRWSHGRWVDYEMVDPDTRSVVTSPGTGVLRATGPLGGEVDLSGVKRDTLVVVRMNYFPAWSASSGGRDVPVFDQDGQLAFRAPADGSQVVMLRYPTRRGLLVLAGFVLFAGTRGAARVGASRAS